MIISLRWLRLGIEARFVGEASGVSSRASRCAIGHSVAAMVPTDGPQGCIGLPVCACFRRLAFGHMPDMETLSGAGSSWNADRRYKI